MCLDVVRYTAETRLDRIRTQIAMGEGDWSVIEAELNSAGMRCRDDETTSFVQQEVMSVHMEDFVII